MNKTLDHVPAWETPKVTILATKNTATKRSEPTEEVVPTGVAPTFGAS